jgi:hypothetical protein
MKIITEHDSPSVFRKHDWAAWEDGTEESGPVGYGKTEAEAIADLREQTEEAEDRRADTAIRLSLSVSDQAALRSEECE